MVDVVPGMAVFGPRNHPARANFFDASKALSILEFVVEREREAVLDVVLRDAVLDLTDAGGICIAPTLITTLLGEAGDVA